MVVNEYKQQENNLVPVLNSKILIIYVRGDKAAKTICINAISTT